MWRADSRVLIRRGKTPAADEPHLYLQSQERLAHVLPRRAYQYQDSHDIDQVAGVQELLAAQDDPIRLEEITCRSLHVAELTCAINAGLSLEVPACGRPANQVRLG